MDENLNNPIPPCQQCVELQCEYCASNCEQTNISCMYSKPPVLQPTECPLNKW